MSLLLARRGTLAVRQDDGGNGGEEEPLIETIGNSSTGSGWGGVFGWEFEVGGSDITCVKLAGYLSESVTRDLLLWRASDEALLASVSVSLVADTWTAGAITPVTLEAETNYVVGIDMGGSIRYDNGGNMTGWEFHPSVSYVTGRFISSAGAFPTSISGDWMRGYPDVIVET